MLPTMPHAATPILEPALTLALAGWASNLLTLGFLLVCVVLILIVLIQRPQGGGLSGAFGSGAGSGQTAFGAKTGDALTIATIGIFVVFLLAAIGLNFAARPAPAPQGGAQPAGAVSPPPTPGATPPADATESEGDTGDDRAPADEVDGAAGEAGADPTEPPTEADAPGEADGG